MTLPIRFDDVHRSFGEKPVLRGLTFTVRPGEVYALLGRNGAGKTTAMRILLGFLAPLGGKSELLGCDSRRLTPQVRARVGLVSEGHALYGWMSVEEVLAFEAGTRARFELTKARALRERLGLDPRAKVGTLSRGQRAQLSLLAATCGEPEILVLDDPAMGLDAVVRRDLLGVMIDLLSDTGASVLFSTHILSDVERIADRIGILHGGRLLVDATLDDLKGRVDTCFVPNGERAALERDVPRCLAAKPRVGGHELFLVDVGDDTRRALVRFGAQAPARRAPALEDLFVELTADARPIGAGASTAQESLEVLR
ncbi:MAG: ABC transporter ATP-binding protein [Planctomycetes bacterium]|nr:ABC transporter ATP-binding protein [Planctomycetota bacterium]